MSSEQRRLAGRYVLEAPIGRGGMGEVWRGTDTVLGRQVAVKTIDLRSLRDESGAARFEREARATAGLSHPNVVTVHDSGVEGDTAYIVMELLPGPSLADELAEGPVPVDEVVEVARQVASALDAAHARGLVHRDIKPGNIAYAADGRARVLDFGITQLTESTDSQALTATHTVMGTAEYLAPEQALGGRVDGRADLYALGCVLYALLAGQPPFRGATPVATMMMHANDPVPDVRVLRPDTPDWLAELVHALLSKDPDERPAGAASVAEALSTRSALGGAATTVLPAAAAATTQRLDAVSPAPVVPPLPPREPERPPVSPWVWVLAAVAAVAIGLLLWNLLRDSSTADPAATPSATPSTSSQPAETTKAPPTTAAPTPTPTATPTATPSPTPTATPSPTPTADPAAPVETALSAFSDEVGVLVRDGTLDQKAARTVDDGVRKVRRALRDGDPQKVSSETDKLAQDYDKAVQDGSIAPDAAAALDPLLADLTDAVKAYAAG
ncbi:MAG: serine/threonine-protein kinase [Ornithinibacter sp.]